MAQLHRQIMMEYTDVFGPVPSVDKLPDHDYCCVKLKDPALTLDSYLYPSPQKYRKACTKLIGEHIGGGPNLLTKSTFVKLGAASNRGVTPGDDDGSSKGKGSNEGRAGRGGRHQHLVGDLEHAFDDDLE
ncbi:hypothetical protein EST38_g10827 [Candolleomyces aberdarensis]|uniref:Uncharacterized protein n=1 Tax=Candolleomyces aberdarensis TaxID=2316362 RepID=A0A4Q2D8U0_9AGAR|nr:hypothetical protein EST38_g10827 [Candolleomyces aberdarensis]